MTLTQVEDVYWHDGHPLTLGDLVFAHEMIAHPDYTVAGGTRWNHGQQNIVGAWEYHNGEADYISGLVLSDDERELTIYFIDFSPFIQYFGFFSSPYPRHIFADMPLEEQRYHYHSWAAPIGWGPFIVQDIIPGEAIHLVANENYWQGRPYLDTVELVAVLWDLVPDYMQTGYLDISPIGINDYLWWPEPDNFHYLGVADGSFGVVNFNLGYFDYDTGLVVPFDNPKMGDARLRRAMAFAIDELYLTAGLFSGMRVPAVSIVSPPHHHFHAPDLTGFNYDPARAKAYLDEAGFLVGPDGWRTDPDGNEFIIHFLTSDFNYMHEISNFYASSWEAVGLQVYIESIDFPSLSSYLLQDDVIREFDVSAIWWSVGSDPNPGTLWGHNRLNIPRFMNDSFQQHLDGFNSHDAWDAELLHAHFHEWQWLFYEYAPAFPTHWRVALTAVNNRVVGYDILWQIEDEDGTQSGLHRIRVTS